MSMRACAAVALAIGTLVAPSAGSLGGAAAAAAAASATPANPLHLIQTQQLSPRLTELVFTTPVLLGPTHVRILTPTGYDPTARTRYPVLYLLHGGGGSYRDWSEQGDVAAITATFNAIVVMPDTGPNDGYSDRYNDGRYGPPMWETYHVGELLPWIDANYRTVPDRAHRAIAGLSMGGGGAMVYAARHPDLFGSAAAFSGAVDTNVPIVWPLVEAGDYDGKISPAVGPRLTQEIRWRGHNP